MKHTRTLSIIVTIASVTLLAGCFGSKNQTVTVGGANSSDGEILETQSFKTVMKTGKTLVDPQHGDEVGFWYGALGGVSPVNANGVGFTHKFKDGVFVHTSNLNIAKLDKGYYVVWLAKDADGTDIKRIGEMQNLLGDVRHSLRYETTEDLSGLTTVIITQETDKAPATHGKIVATGTLKEVKQ